MEQKIKNYEQFIQKAAKTPTRELAAYHREMVANFNHERLIHLLIMLFFVALTIASIFVIFTLTSITSEWAIIVPAIVLSILLLVITLCYIRHYYFLENHIQKLYKYSKILHKL